MHNFINFYALYLIKVGEKEINPLISEIVATIFRVKTKTDC